MSAIAVLIGNLRGIAVGDDGVGYQAIADSLLAGEGLGYFLERPLTIWPPGWPALMAAVAKVTPLDTVQAAVLLNMITAAVVVLLLHAILSRLTRHELPRFAGMAVTAVGASSMIFGHLLMTDFAFAAITLGLFLVMFRYRDTGSFVWLAAAAALVWAGFLTRYAGVVHIGTVGLWVLADRRAALSKRVVHGIGFGVAAAVLPAAWVARNIDADGTTLGERYSSARGLIHNIYDTAATIGNFLSPAIESERRGLWILVGAAGSAVVVAMLWRAVRADTRFRSARGLLDVVASPVGLVALHVAVYAAYMLYARTTTGLNQLDFRLLNPIYLPLVICALVVADRLLALPDTPENSLWSRAARYCVVAWAVLNVVVGIGMVGFFTTDPALFPGNYERDEFEVVRESPALDAIPADCPTVSNLPNALYGSGVDARWSWRHTGLESNDVVDDLDQLIAGTEAGTRYCLVWISLDPTYGHLVTLDELGDLVTLRPLASGTHVDVYEVTAR